MNRFVFIMPAFNAEQTVARAILSVWFQSFPNWKIIIRDDMSTDSTAEVIKNLRSNLGLEEDRISLVTNTEKKWEVANILDMLKECEAEDIICRLDADDYLCDCDTLAILNQRYETMGVDVIWTNHRWGIN